MGWFGKACRGTVRVLGGGCKFLGSVTAAPFRYGGKAFGSACEFVGLERVGRTITHSTEAVAKVIEVPSRVADQALRQVANVGSFVVSDLIGDSEDAMEAEREGAEAFESFTGHFMGVVDELGDAVNEFSGRVLYDKAEAADAKIRKERRKLQKVLNDKREDLRVAINGELKKINACRRLSGIHFRRFEQVAKAIANWKIYRYESIEVFGDVKISLSPMTSESKVFSDVDFKKSPIQNYLKGIMTGGLLIDSQVKDVYVKIEGLRKALNEEVNKARAEQTRWAKVRESLETIRKNFEAFIKFYAELVNELDYALEMLRMNYYLRDFNYFGKTESELNVYFLPERHLKCLMACDKMSRILCTMAKQKYLDKNAIDVNAGEVEQVEAFKKQKNALKRQLAA